MVSDELLLLSVHIGNPGLKCGIGADVLFQIQMSLNLIGGQNFKDDSRSI